MANDGFTSFSTVQMYMIFNIFICIIHHLRMYYELTMLPAQLVEHLCGIEEVMGKNPVQA